MRISSTRAPPVIVDRGVTPSPLQDVPWLDNPFPDYKIEPVYLSYDMSAVAVAKAEALA